MDVGSGSVESGGTVQKSEIRPTEPIPRRKSDFKDVVAAIIALLLVATFCTLLGLITWCHLFTPNCHGAVEIMGVVANILGPIVGGVVAFYFSVIVIARAD